MSVLFIVASLFVFGATSWGVLSHHFHDGLLLKKGLMLMSVTSMSSAWLTGMGNYSPTVIECMSMVAFAIIAASVLLRRLRRPLWKKG